MNIKKCIVTIVNIEYLEIFNKFLYFYNKNTSFDLIVYTINFDYSNRNTNKIKYIPHYDANLVEYEFKNENKYIKNFSDKYKYLVALKPKIVNQSLLLNYDCFLYLDADCIITPFFDNYYLNYNDISQKYPLCPNYKHDFMIYNGKGSPFDKNGEFSFSNTLEAELFKYFKLQQNRSAYRHTYAYIYNKNCNDFFNEANDILFNLDLFNKYNIYFPLLDETVFNFIFWKRRFNKSLGILPFIDFVLNFNDIKDFESFNKKQNIACLHVKFYKKFFDSSVLTDFKEIDHEKYNFLEKVYSINNNFIDFYYNINLENDFLIFNFTLLNDKKLSILIIDDNSNFLYRADNRAYAKFLPYFISVPYVKNTKMQLIFLDEQDNIVYSINENFNS
jgi:hypothetical protein